MAFRSSFGAAALLFAVVLILAVPSANSVGGGKKKGGGSGQEQKRAGGGGGGRGQAPGAAGDPGKGKKQESEGFAAMEAGNFEVCVKKFAKAAKLDPSYSDHHTQVSSPTSLHP